MALLLSSERPAQAAVTLNPFRLVAVWAATARKGRAQRTAFHNLLGFDSQQLDDLGINRGDLFDAMHSEPRRAARVLNEARAAAATNWLNP